MGFTRLVSAALLAATILLALLAPACKGGGGGGPVTVNSIMLNPAAPSTSTLIQLSASITAPGRSVSSLSKEWRVSAGSLSASAPDFAFILRATAKEALATSLTTTNDTVYWIAPAAAGAATITLTVLDGTKTVTAQVGASPVTLSVTDGAGGTKICTVRANSVADLYQAAFRINYSSAWHPTAATAGDFLGSASERLFIGLVNQNGFVPCALTKRGSVPGNDGSGTLATVTFAPAAGGASSLREASAQPFSLGLVILRNSQDEPIQVPEG